MNEEELKNNLEMLITREGIILETLDYNRKRQQEIRIKLWKLKAKQLKTK